MTQSLSRVHLNPQDTVQGVGSTVTIRFAIYGVPVATTTAYELND
jgi:hypothetical protein